MQPDLSHAVNYHYNQFPPAPDTLNYAKFLDAFGKASDAIARFDQMLKSIHNSEILLAPM